MGSGAAGMGAAVRGHDLGLDVLLVEKSELYGGNSAMSGGVCWVANNPGMAGQGIADSDEEGFKYLKHITKGEVPDDRLWLYIRESKRVLAYLHDKTHVRYVPLAKYTDYYPEAPGGRDGGRSMDPQRERWWRRALASQRWFSWRGRCSCTSCATSSGSAGDETPSSVQATR
jgi:3-oxosteroid 1-dehydrogenase